MENPKKKIIVFASGTKDGGGSGFENLVNATMDGRLSGEISVVVSNHENGGVRQWADKLGVPFVYFPARKVVEGEAPDENSNTAENYKRLTEGADLVCLSGWLKLVSGLDPQKTINIHPGPLPRFGGAGMYGHYVHEAVMEAYRTGAPDPLTGEKVTHSAVSMHFVTDEYDRGPLFFSQPVEILPDDTAESLATRVNEAEHKWQPLVTDKVLRGEIFWDGKNFESLKSSYISSKKFDLWNTLKKKINNQNKKIFCNAREIWWASIGVNVGSEEDGKNELFERPVLITNVFNKDIIRVMPLTSKHKEDKHHISIKYDDRIGSAILSQTKTMSVKRLSRKLCRLDKKQFQKVIKKLKENI